MKQSQKDDSAIEFIGACEAERHPAWVRHASRGILVPFTIAAAHLAAGCDGLSVSKVSACSPLDAATHPYHIEVTTSSYASTGDGLVALVPIIYRPG